jgi:hypothetical protein
MTPEDFVIQIRKSIVDENLSAYKDVFTSTAIQNATDPHWQRALRLYAKMESDDQEVLFDIIRQVMIDTISNVFAILDGVTELTGQEGDFSLLANLPPEKLSGELQDRFLELEEKSQ